jgi:hypothetical protein
MALDVVGDFIEVAGRFLFRILNEVLVEFLCKGTGYLICKPFKSNVDPDGFLAFAVGFIFWLAAVILGFQLYEFIKVDQCLDSGGSFDYANKKCVK